MKKTLLILFLFSLISWIFAKPMQVDITAGVEWSHTYWFMKIIPIKLTPQIAVWTADSNDNLIETLFVTEADSKINRSEALPYWNSKSTKQEMQVTSATPKTDFSISWSNPEANIAYIYAEVNNSFDYNENFPKQKGNVDGQPALIYRAKMDYDSQTIVLDPYGISRGASVHKDYSALTTALEIISNIKVKVKN